MLLKSAASVRLPRPESEILRRSALTVVFFPVAGSV
jgi:hypothetical protein